LTAASESVAFLARSEPLDYGRRLSRLRWRRRFPGRPAIELSPAAPADAAFAGAERWIVISDDTALPAPGPDVPAAPGRVLVAGPLSPATGPVVHTLRELEGAAAAPGWKQPAANGAAPALVFRPSDFPPLAGETVEDYVSRIASLPMARDPAPLLGAVVFEDAPGGDRGDVTQLFPAGVRRLLDVGCGTGMAAAALCRQRPGLAAIGIERDPRIAALARKRLPDVREGDAATVLSGLAAAGERFDALLFADVLEHFEDPVRILGLARGVASGGATLVASVPNVGHLSLVRDLLLGRFDPLPAGLADSGHLRWFTRASLSEALEEAGWTDVAIHASPGAAPPDAEEFLRRAEEWTGADRESLTTYQWIAVARPALP
jgi:SAM-dependent methyltransferase